MHLPCFGLKRIDLHDIPSFFGVFRPNSSSGMKETPGNSQNKYHHYLLGGNGMAVASMKKSARRAPEATRIFELPYLGIVDNDHTALIFGDIKVSYGTLRDMVRKYARFFKDRGIKQGDRVAISMPNCPEFIYTYLGASMAGAILVPLNLLLSLEEIAYIIQDSAATTLVLHPAILERLDPAAANAVSKMPFRIVLLNQETKEHIENLEPIEFEFTGQERLIPSRTSCADSGQPAHDGKDSVELSGSRLGSDISSLLYTSGTTGRPKGAILSHQNLLANVKQLDDASDLGPDDNFICVLPMFHSFGWTVCVLLPIYLGSTITILDGFKPKETLSTLMNEGITVFCGVPAMFTVLSMMLDKPTSLSCIKLAISGGAPLPETVINAFDSKFGCTLLEGYGLSEASPVVALNPIGGIRKIGSIGIALPGIEIRIVDEAMNDVPRGEVGEVAVRGNNIMSGYYNLPQETESVLVDGWLLTGDLGRMDGDGYIYIVDRKKDVIIVSGFNVYPREIEEVILTHPKVQDAAVLGVRDPIKGEMVKAYIIPKEAVHLDKTEIFEFLKPKLARYKMPQIIEFTDSLPRNPSGKVLKRLLK